MRYLFLLQGAPGAGKSTFIERQGLAPYTVSSDQIRLLFRSPELSPLGGTSISTRSDNAVWRTLREMVDERLRHGDLTIIDATHTRRREVEQYSELAAMNRYRTFIVTWRGVSLEDCLKRNAGRPDLRRLPDYIVAEMHTRLETFEAPPWVERTLTEGDFASVLRDSVIDGAKYARIHVIGDLQGCATPLAAYLGGGAEALEPNDLYIFVGDFLDRGIENAAVMRLMLELAKRDNVLLCEGNHERHLRNWSLGFSATSRLFETKTRVELEAGAIDREATKAMLARLHDAVLVLWRGQRILVSHGGVARMPDPDTLAFIPSAQLSKGVGTYDFDVDAAFAANSPANALQVHGHRNELRLPITAARGSYNLEGRVEYGGSLRVVRFHADGRVEPIEIENKHFDIQTTQPEDDV